MSPTGDFAGDCPLCGSSELDERRRVSNLQGEDVEIVRCAGCALVRRNVGPDRDRYHADENPVTYSEAWARAKAADLSLPGHESVWRDRVYFALREFLDASPEKRPRVLEVGCGIGHNLAAFRRYGCDVTGVEPSSAAARFGRERFGLRIIEEYVDDADLGAGQFDLVILDSVLEHLPDPVGTLASLRSLIAPGGRLYVDVPNLRAWYGKLLGRSWNIYEPGHINFFTPETAAKAVEAAGFKVVKATTHDGLVTWGLTFTVALNQAIKKVTARAGGRAGWRQAGVDEQAEALQQTSGLEKPVLRHRVENSLWLALGIALTPLRRIQFRRGGGMGVWILAEVSDRS
ncbi:MAG: hypothetical protein DCC49_03450 [Acidobacteria bacterium]|nr:MAG: hypothetical protein DCC49_03450 [Acidobacteriota bacterium]